MKINTKLPGIVGVLLFCTLYNADAQNLNFIKKISNSLQGGINHSYPLLCNDSNDLFLNYFVNSYWNPQKFVFGDTIPKGKSNNQTDFGIVKLDTGGNKQWNMLFKRDSFASPINQTITDGKNIYLLISLNFKGPDIYFNGKRIDSLRWKNKKGEVEYFILKINPQGKILWKKQFYSPNKGGRFKFVKWHYNPELDNIQAGIFFYDSIYIQRENGTFLGVRDPNRNYTHCQYVKDSSRMMLLNFDTKGRIQSHRFLPLNIADIPGSLHSAFFKSIRNKLFLINAPCTAIQCDNITIDSGETVFFRADSNGNADLKFRVDSHPQSFNSDRLNICESENLVSITRTYSNNIPDSSRLLLRFKSGDTAGLQVSEIILLDSSFQIKKKRKLFPFAAQSPVRVQIQDVHIRKNHIYVQAILSNYSWQDFNFNMDGYKVVIPTGHPQDIYGYTNEISMVMKLDTNLNVLWLEYISNKFNQDGAKSSFAGNLEIDRNNGVYTALGISHTDSFNLFNARIRLNDTNYYHLIKLDNNGISRGDLSAGPYCAGDSINIPFSKEGIFKTGNEFIAELSDYTGSFDDPLKVKVIGKIEATNDSVIKAVFPASNFISSSRYRIRIRSSLPMVYSYYRIDTLRLMIYSTDTAYAGEDAVICRGDTVPLMVSGGSEWKWIPSKGIHDPDSFITYAVPDSSTRYMVVIKDRYGCGITDTAYKLIKVNDDLSVQFSPGKDQALCIGSEVLLKAAFRGGDSLSYKWVWTIRDSRNNYYMPGEDSFALSDSVLFKLPANEKDSIQVYVYLHDACSKKPINAMHTLKMKKTKSMTNIAGDTVVCPGSIASVRAGFTGADSQMLSWKWQERTSSNIWINLKSETGRNSDTLFYQVDTNRVFSKQFRIILSDNCSLLKDTLKFKIHASGLPELKVNVTDTILCHGNTLMMKAEGIGGSNNTYKFLWVNTTTGDTLSESDSLNFKAGIPSDIRVTLNDFCSPHIAAEQFEIDVYPELKAAVSIQDTLICNGQKVHVSAKVNGGRGNGYVYRWMMDGSILGREDSLIFKGSDDSMYSGGRYTIYLIAGDNCSIPEDSIRVNINELSAISASVKFVDSICFGRSALFEASATGGNGLLNFHWISSSNILLGNGDSILMVNNGSNDIAGKLIASDNCSDNDTIDINSVFLEPLKVSMIASDTCTGQDVNLFASGEGGKTGRYKFNWYQAAKFLGQGQSINTVSGEKMNIRVVLEDYCSIQNDSAEMTVYRKPIPRLSATGFCFGDITEINSGIKSDSGIYKYEWFVDRNPVSDNDSILLRKFPGTGNYKVALKVSSENNCEGLDSISIDILAKPRAVFQYVHFGSGSAGIAFKFINLSTNYTNAYWDFNNGDTSMHDQPDYSFTDTGSARVSLIVSNQDKCFDSTYQIFPVYPQIRFYFPNVFSPDGNGLNEKFGLNEAQLSFVSEYSIKIFNRWGELVFDSDDAGKYWTGGDCQQGVYIYIAEIRDVYRVLHELEGVLELLR